MNSQDSLRNTTFILLIIMISLVLLYFGQKFLIPLVLAIMAWSLLNALAGHFSRIGLGGWYIPRWLALVLAVAFLLAMLLLVYQVVVSQAADLRAAAPVYQENFNATLNQVLTRFGINELPTSDRFLKEINIGTLLGWVGGSVGSLLTTLVLVMIYTGFLFAEQNVMLHKLKALTSSPEEAEKLHGVFREIAIQIQSYIWMKSLVSLATGILSYLVLKWVDVDFAAVWALLIFMLNFIPNIGSILGVMLPALLTLVQFDTLTPFIIITVGLGAVQFIFGNMVEPALMGKSLNLSSLMIILSLTFWGLLWGIPGMFLSVPIMVMLAIICSRFKSLRSIAVVLSSDGQVSGYSAESLDMRGGHK